VSFLKLLNIRETVPFALKLRTLHFSHSQLVCKFHITLKIKATISLNSIINKLECIMKRQCVFCEAGNAHLDIM
jgi:hypothetical protein